MRKRRATSASHPDEHERVLFAARVRAARAVLGWSQTELARRTAVTQRAMGRHDSEISSWACRQIILKFNQ
jgi:ribosome-binding protein aMBF1 (putative translation factor)